MQTESSEEQKDFVERCERMMVAFRLVNMIETSNRVWASCIMTILEKVFASQPRYEESMEQFIDVLRRFVRDQKKQKEEEE
jgi:hypothetical protein